MRVEQTQVTSFMLKADQECPPRPSIPSTNTCILRLDLIQEELDELRSAFNHAYSQDGKYEKFDALVEMADAITDLLVVVLGTAVACGIDIQPCWDEVHRSNMTKFIDGHRRADGKWIKGPSYSPANLSSIIEKQLTR